MQISVKQEKMTNKAANLDMGNLIADAV